MFDIEIWVKQTCDPKMHMINCEEEKSFNQNNNSNDHTHDVQVACSIETEISIEIFKSLSILFSGKIRTSSLWVQSKTEQIDWYLDVNVC